MGAGYPFDWNQRRKQVFKRDNYTCQNCGRSNVELHCHHIVKKSRGGTHEMDNLTTLCKECHDATHGRGYAPTYERNRSWGKKFMSDLNRWFWISMIILIIIAIIF